MLIQQTYRKYQGKGMPGELARAGEPHVFDLAVVKVDLKPGVGVVLDADGEWIAPAASGGATHILGYDVTATNNDLTTPVGNQTTEIVIKAGTPCKALAMGSVFVEVAEEVIAGDKVTYDPAAGWDKGTTATDAARFVVLTAASAGELAVVRHYGVL